MRRSRVGRFDCGASCADSDLFAQVAVDRSRTSQHVAGFHGRAAVPAHLADFIAGCAAVYGCSALTVEGSQSLDADIPGRQPTGISEFFNLIFNVILILNDFSCSRVFVTLLYMGFKSMQIQQQYFGEIHLLDPVLSVSNDQLSPLDGENQNQLALSHLDLPFVNWLLQPACCTAAVAWTKRRPNRWICRPKATAGTFYRANPCMEPLPASPKAAEVPPQGSTDGSCRRN